MHFSQTLVIAVNTFAHHTNKNMCTSIKDSLSLLVSDLQLIKIVIRFITNLSVNLSVATTIVNQSISGWDISNYTPTNSDVHIYMKINLNILLAFIWRICSFI